MWCKSPMTLPCWGSGNHLLVHRRQQGVTKPGDSRTGLERPAREGNSPVHEIVLVSRWTSRVASGISGVNLRGPPRKAKYYLMTDSGLVP